MQASLLASLGRSLQNLGEPLRAEELHRHALALRRAVLPPDDPAIGVSHFDIGWALLGQDRRHDAEDELALAVAMLRSAATGSLDLARAMSALGVLRSPSPQAETLLVEAVAIAERHPRPPPGMLPTILAELSTHYDQTGRRAEAIRLLERAIRLQRRALGPVHPNLGTMQANLATRLHTSGDLEGAARTYREAIATLESAFAKDHAKLTAPLTSYARLLVEHGRIDEAEPVAERAFAVCRERLPESHFLRLAAETNLASVRAAQGRLEEAIDGYRSVLGRMAASAGDRHPGTFRVRSLLGAALAAAGARFEARDLLRAALDYQRTAPLPPFHLADTALFLGALLRDEGALGEAEPLLREALALRGSFLPDGDWQIAAAQIELGQLLLSSDRAGEAATLLRPGAETLARSLGPATARGRRAAELLARLDAAPAAAREPSP